MSFEHTTTPPVGRAFEKSVSPPDPNQPEQAVDEKSLDKPEFNYDPPEPVPGGQAYSNNGIDEVVREELSNSEQAGVREAQRTERRFEEPSNHSELDFNDAASVEKEWTEESAHEYGAWSREGEDERDEENTPESAEEFDARMQDAMDDRDRDLDRDCQEI